jgi:shikimate kinase
VSEGGRAPHLILVGLPGAGKSTTGRMLARRLGRPFLDFDVELARREGKTVAEIFAGRGEAYFRALEASLSAELVDARPMVLAPGGGWMANAGAVAPLRERGRIIYLRVSPETALRRMGRGYSRRPLLRGPDPLEALRRLYAERDALYAAADHVFDTERFYQQQLTSVIASLADVSEEA